MFAQRVLSVQSIARSQTAVSRICERAKIRSCVACRPELRKAAHRVAGFVQTNLAEDEGGAIE